MASFTAAGVVVMVSGEVARPDESSLSKRGAKATARSPAESGNTSSSTASTATTIRVFEYDTVASWKSRSPMEFRMMVLKLSFCVGVNSGT